MSPQTENSDACDRFVSAGVRFRGVAVGVVEDLATPELCQAELTAPHHAAAFWWEWRAATGLCSLYRKEDIVVRCENI